MANHWPKPCSGELDRCPPKAKVTRSNRVGCASFSLFYNAICRPSLRLQFWFIRASKQFGEISTRARIGARNAGRSRYIEMKLVQARFSYRELKRHPQRP